MSDGQKPPFRKQAFLFAETCEQVRQLSLTLAAGGVPNALLHGKVEQDVRNKSMQLFKDGKLAVLALSDVRSRGMDMKNVDVVWNFEMPGSLDTYIHRVGRCGRNKAGESYTFVDVKDKPVLEKLRKIIRDAGHEAPDSLDEFLDNI
uniref:Helicase C-terminal domain-containing protein n=1 Tax=Panagrolaimus davidi TaxID=227884 RepID=A0A914Q9U3_9BILA